MRLNATVQYGWHSRGLQQFLTGSPEFNGGASPWQRGSGRAAGSVLAKTPGEHHRKNVRSDPKLAP